MEGEAGEINDAASWITQITQTVEKEVQKEETYAGFESNRQSSLGGVSSTPSHKRILCR